MIFKKTDDKAALGRTLNISRALYASVAKGELKNPVALFDTLSAALSHTGDEKKPLSKCMKKLKSEIKSKNKVFYNSIGIFLNPVMPVLDYDYEMAKKHIPAMIYGNDKICEKLVKGQLDRAKSMSDAMKSYPGYLLGEFNALSGEQFYDLVFGYYPKLYDEEFMDEMKKLFIEDKNHSKEK